MKLIVQIPCLNEASSLPDVIRDIPRAIENISDIEIVVIDDGSTDGTGDIAKDLGADCVIRSTQRKGLAKAFITGIDISLKRGADIIVNLDGDGQYDPKDIPAMIKPILEGRAEMVIGNRHVEKLAHFSFIKKKLQKIGSWVVCKVSGTRAPDVTSGFRAFSKQAALALNVTSDFTYTIETLIQAGTENIALDYVSVKARPVVRKSRLFRTIREYVTKSVYTILRIYTMYQPLKVFSFGAVFVFLISAIFFARFIQFHIQGSGTQHIQYLIVGSVVALLSFQIFMIGLLAGLIASNRKLIEDTLKRVKDVELKAGTSPDDSEAPGT